jgi:uncharacterized protein YjbI with pentapeptide repeats
VSDERQVTGGSKSDDGQAQQATQPPASELDDSEPSPERQAELRAAYEANVASGKAPYQSVEISTRGELTWAIREHDWSGERDAEGNERPNLSGANLDRANLSGALLAGANLSGALLAGANLSDALLDKADLSRAFLASADLSGANLHSADLSGANLHSADLSGANLYNAGLNRALLDSAHLSGANLDKADLSGAILAGADLSGARLVSADLSRTRLDKADLRGALLDKADLRGARLDSANLSGTHLDSANLSGAGFVGARMDVDTKLEGIRLDSTARLADINWNGVPLTRVDWEQMRRLGDEAVAWQPRDDDKSKDAARRRGEFTAEARANRQLATVLRDQGLNDDADRYGYRAQVLQRQVLWRQGRWLGYLGALFLDTIAGHGYRPGRSILTYVAVIVGFAAAYFMLGHGAPLYLNPQEALFTSIISFHGRGFFPTSFNLANPITPLVALEAMCGLLIEITFIATFTNRFFAR